MTAGKKCIASRISSQRKVVNLFEWNFCWTEPIIEEGAGYQKQKLSSSVFKNLRIKGATIFGWEKFEWITNKKQRKEQNWVEFEVSQ